MTKLEKVLRFFNKKKNYNFTWKKFIQELDIQYPSSETNYLRMLVNAQYVIKTGRGKYHVAILPSPYMSYRQLQRESKLNRNTRTL